jgi:protein N-terminal glutamine amidohydrolase
VTKIDPSSLDYQSYYCEENVWRLLARREFITASSWAVLVSSKSRSVVLLRQRAGRPGDGLVHWDYHVFAVLADASLGKLAFDMDSTLPFPCPLSRYLEETFPRDVQRAYEPRFRLVEGAQYVAELSSDRSHMRKPDGGWIAPPPPWPAPGEGKGRRNNLLEWANPGRRSPGALCDLERMAAFASSAARGA